MTDSLPSRRAFLLGATLAPSLAAATGHKAVVACEYDPPATAALSMIAAGGNAMDAAAAACLVSCITMPHAVDIGGYVAGAVVLDAKTGKVWSIDANAAAPDAARPAMFQVLPVRPGARSLNENEYGCSVKDNANVDGALAVTVPGTLAGIGTLWERWGKLKWPQIVAPSQELLAKGFAVRKDLAAAVRDRSAVIRTMPSAAAHFLPDGRALQEGQLWHRPGMEWTLQRIASAGWQDFYRGEIAGKIADHLRMTGGILTRADLARYEARVAPAAKIQCGETRAFTAPLANGGISVLSAMLLLHELKPPPSSDPMHWHLLAEVMKIVWRDRLRYLGDPTIAKIDWERFLRPSYVDERLAKLRKSPQAVDMAMAPPPAPGPGTIHISTADAEGNLVAITISHGGSFGSCVTVPGTGVTLGHGMCRFDPHPGLPNSIAPGKRPLNNICPAILRQPGRDVAFGMRGGRRIVSVVSGAALQLLQGGGLQEVAASPRLHTEGYEPIQAAKLPPAISQEMAKMGHHVVDSRAIGGTTNFVSRSSDGRLESASTALATGV